MGKLAPLRQPRRRDKGLEVASIRIVIETPCYPSHALLVGFDFKRHLAFHLTDASLRHHNCRKQNHADEVPIRTANCIQLEISEVETETWQPIGKQGGVHGEA